MLTQATLTKIAKLNNQNDHTGALYVAARGLDLSDLAQKFEDLECEQEAAGHLTPKIEHARLMLRCKLFTQASLRLSEADYVRFCRCF
jgi:hypothetical protein